MEREPTARLMLHALRRFEAELQERLHADGYADVTVGHTNVLRHLDSEGMRMNALARDAGVTKQAVTQAVRALTARDLVRLEPDPDDARAKRVVYTERGRALIRCALGHIADIEQCWADQLGADRYAALRDALATLHG